MEQYGIKNLRSKQEERMKVNLIMNNMIYYTNPKNFQKTVDKRGWMWYTVKAVAERDNLKEDSKRSLKIEQQERQK